MTPPKQPSNEMDVRQEKEKKEKMLREKYMQLQMLLQQMKKAREQQEIFDQQVTELESVKESLDELKTVKRGTEILTPISGGMFIKAELKDTEKVIVNVGASVSVEKTIDEAAMLIQEQITEIKKYREQLHQQIHVVQEQTELLEKEFKRIIGKESD